MVLLLQFSIKCFSKKKAYNLKLLVHLLKNLTLNAIKCETSLSDCSLALLLGLYISTKKLRLLGVM